MKDLNTARKSKTLNELEDTTWGEPTFDSHLVQTCHRLRKKPIGEFTTEELRIMIGQNISLFFLVPIAIEVLEQDPLAEGAFYPGDLLCVMLKADPKFWKCQANLRQKLDTILEQMEEVPSLLENELEYYRKEQT